jgi:citrate lyase subunit beta / citryl-CoA lyase
VTTEPVSASLAPRSFLYVPGDRSDRITKAFASRADAVIMDLEDAVKPERKADARTNAVDAARAFKYFGKQGKAVWIRINGDRNEAMRDIDAFGACEGIHGLLLAKCESSEWLSMIADRVPQAVQLSPLIESALSLHNIEAILAHPRCAAPHLGELDLLADLGGSGAGGERLLQRARETLVFACATLKTSAPIGGVHVAINDLDELRTSTILLSELGFSSRALIHPSHCDIVNEVFTPSTEQLAWAKGVLEQLEGSNGAIQSADGTMIDEAVARRARALQARSR